MMCMGRSIAIIDPPATGNSSSDVPLPAPNLRKLTMFWAYIILIQRGSRLTSKILHGSRKKRKKYTQNINKYWKKRMSKRILSYSLFRPKVMPSHRHHDEHKSEKDRYWYNLLAVALTNRALYPEHDMLLYVSPSIAQHRLSNAISILNKLPNFSYQTVEMEYAGTEPATWRMLPLWRRDVGLLHT